MTLLTVVTPLPEQRKHSAACTCRTRSVQFAGLRCKGAVRAL